MDLDTLLVRYFGQSDLSAISEGAFGAGIDRLQVEFGLEQDRERRFGLWSVMYMLGVAPDLATAFKMPEDQDAARDFMDLVDRTSAT